MNWNAKASVVMKHIASCLAAAACLVGGSAALAGTSTATASATLNIVNQCTVTGANVSLGTFKTTDTLQTVANQTGYQDSATYDFVPGTNGIGTASLGSVTCDAGTPYTISMRGYGPLGSIEIQTPVGALQLYTTVKKIGDYIVPDGDTYLNGFGKEGSPDALAVYPEQSPLGTTANGAPQQIMGNIVPWLYPTHTDGYIGADEQLGVAGVYTGSWVTTLNF